MRSQHFPFLSLLAAVTIGAACSSDDKKDATGTHGGRREDAGNASDHATDGGGSASNDGGKTGGASADGGGRDGDAAAGGGDAAPGSSSGDGGAPHPIPDAGRPTILVRNESPWGIAPSHSSSVGIASWAEAIADTGIDWIRGFDQDNADSVLSVASTNGFQVTGIFSFSDPGGPQTFPVDSIDAFKDYVTTTVTAAPSVSNWEVWNEPPNFSESKSPADYAKIVVAAYEAAKAANTGARVGLATQSVNLNFLAQALDAGAFAHFDYVTVHPYETLGLVDDGWETQFMSIVPAIRKLLADKSPAERDVEVWFTELGEPVQGDISAEHQADTLVKAYVLGIAQGALRIHWFEPLDGDSGPFGLIAGADDSAPKRPSFTAVSKLIEHLGKIPSYLGWVLLNDKHYAFVFENESENESSFEMVCWTAKGVTDTFDVGAKVQIVDLHTGTAHEDDTLELTHSPLLVSGVPEALADEARGHNHVWLPWGGDYSHATSVSYTAKDGARGLHPLGKPSIKQIDDAPAHDASGGTAVSFTVDPAFLLYDPIKVRITAVVRRNGGDAAGFNLKYESTSGWKASGDWYDVPGSDKWYTKSWTISDPQFVGKWGYNFALDSDSTDHSKYSIQSVTVTKL